MKGILSERYAFCQTMPLDDFLTTAQALRTSGYRPVRFRPYGNGQQVRVAAVWTRDERNWRISSGLTPSEVCQVDEDNRKDMFVPSDVVGYITTGKDGTLCDIYAAVWVEKPGDDDTRLYVGSTSDQETEAQERLKQSKLIPRTLHALTGADGRTRYCGVWGRPPETGFKGQSHRDQLEGKFEQNKSTLSDQLLIDMAVDGALKAQSTRESAHSDLRLATVWTSDARFEASSIYGIDPAAQLEKSRKLIAQGYRPVSLSVKATATEGPLVTASVWHRPTVPEDVKDRLAERQARAAVAVVRLGNAEEVFPLLGHSADPRLRSFIVNWLYPLGADPKLVAGKFDRIDPDAKPTPAQRQQSMDAVLFHPEISQRRALIQALGTYGADGLSPGEREPLAQVARPLQERSRQRNPRGGGMDPAAMEAAREAQGTRRRVEQTE